MADGIRVPEQDLIEWVAKVFEKGKVPREHALISARVLVVSDVRGHESHGVARLPYYWRKIENGTINVDPHPRVVHEMPAVALFDGDNGLGPVVGNQAMELAINKAKESGAGFVSVTNSTHYGIAGYYSMMAMDQGMIGISMTNAFSLVAPTFGKEPNLGTNPISMAAPANKERPFVLDMATTASPAGKIEVAVREQKPIPAGWLLDKEGLPTDQPLAMFQGGTLLPLGSDYEHRSYKGYGLVLMVDILSAVLSNANYGHKQEGMINLSAKPEPSNVGHFFGALLVDGFRPLDEFKKTMDDALRALKDSPKIEGHERVYVAGEPEFETAEDSRKNGVQISAVVVNPLTGLGDEVGVKFDFI
jgi:LDH2 family malate/lactate/ureidoglycolate dehydrogenase